jgi:hypothetical protein
MGCQCKETQKKVLSPRACSRPPGMHFHSATPRAGARLQGDFSKPTLASRCHRLRRDAAGASAMLVAGVSDCPSLGADIFYAQSESARALAMAEGAYRVNNEPIPPTAGPTGRECWRAYPRALRSTDRCRQEALALTNYGLRRATGTDTVRADEGRHHAQSNGISAGPADGRGRVVGC